MKNKIKNILAALFIILLVSVSFISGYFFKKNINKNILADNAAKKLFYKK